MQTINLFLAIQATISDYGQQSPIILWRSVQVDAMVRGEFLDLSVKLPETY